MRDFPAPEAAPIAVCAVIPVYNHPRTIAAVVAAVRGHYLPVILVDDGSDADCAAVLAGLAADDDGTSLITLAHNEGKGGAVTAGARFALAAGFSHALQIDADGQHDTHAISAALALAWRAPTALVMGVPRFDASIPRSRLYGRWLTHVLVWVEALTPAIRDAMCGFRVYPLAELVALDNRHRLGRRMDFDIDAAVRLVWDDVPIVRLDVAVQYPADGVSHFNLVKDNVLITLTHLRLLAGMLIRLPLILCQRLFGVFAR